MIPVDTFSTVAVHSTTCPSLADDKLQVVYPRIAKDPGCAELNTNTEAMTSSAEGELPEMPTSLDAAENESLAELAEKVSTTV
jgi:hypothetical protein